MKKLTLYFLLFLLSPVMAFAQSSMSDAQVRQYIIKEYEAGKDKTEIVTQLMKRGVSMEQLQRVRAKVERERQELGNQKAQPLDNKTASRLRKANDKERAQQRTSNRLKKEKDPSKKNTYDKNDDDFMEMSDQLDLFLPTDTATLLKRYQEAELRKKRKIFGQDIFNNEEISFEPNLNIATPGNYRIGAGDHVFIDIYGASQKTIDDVVSPEGTVVIPDFGPVHLDGKTVEEANRLLRNTLGSRYQDSHIQITVGQTKTILVNVMGEVVVPGTYTLSAFSTVFHALYMAGGTNELGSLRDIKVYRRGRLISTVDLYDFILNGKLQGNVRLEDDDVIIVGTYNCLVDITGKVKRPMYYQMKPTESVATLIRYAGGFSGDAYRKAVRLVRHDGRAKTVYNVEELDMNSFRLMDGDSLHVDSTFNRYVDMVEVTGEVFRPGRYHLGDDITTVRSLIEHAEGLTEAAFTPRAVLYRLTPNRTLTTLRIDLKGIMDGSVPDVPLKDNDHLFVARDQSANDNYTLTIHGEVNYPGVYRYASKETIEDLILAAGGLTDAASTVKVDVARRLHNPKATHSDSILSENFSFELKDGFLVDHQNDFYLEPYDEVYVRKSPIYQAQKNVEVVGQVEFPGKYTLSSKDEHLSELVVRAGGLNALAYPRGARLERKMNAEEILRKNTLLKLAARNSGNDSIDVEKLDVENTYYVAIELTKALQHPGGEEDIALREGDRLIVPEYTATVKISGEVMYPNTISYEEGKKLSYYIQQAGGYSDRAKRSKTMIVYMNGKVENVKRSTPILPGSEIVVPSKPKRSGLNLAQWLTIGTSVTSIATMIVTMANVLKK